MILHVDKMHHGFQLQHTLYKLVHVYVGKGLEMYDFFRGRNRMVSGKPILHSTAIISEINRRDYLFMPLMDLLHGCSI